MGHPIADQSQTLADELAAARAELRNAKALADHLQPLLDSKTHQIEALHAELESTRHANKLIIAERERWMAHCVDAESTIADMLEILRPHVAPVFDEAGTPLDAARYIASRLTTDAEPDIDTVPLADLLETAGTFLEAGQGIRITNLGYESPEVRVYALDREFLVESHEASEVLSHAHELAQHLLQD